MAVKGPQIEAGRNAAMERPLRGAVDLPFIAELYGKPEKDLEAAWTAQLQQDYLGHGSGLVPDMIVFALTTIVFIAVCLIVRRRRLIIRQRLQEEEEWADGEW